MSTDPIVKLHHRLLLKHIAPLITNVSEKDRTALAKVITDSVTEAYYIGYREGWDERTHLFEPLLDKINSLYNTSKQD